MSLAPFVITALLLVAVTLVSAVISAMETALLSLKEHHTAVIDEGRPDLTGMMRSIARQPHRSIHQVVLLGTLLNLTIAVLALLLLREFGPLIPERPHLSAGLLFGTIILFGELIPTLAALVAPVPVIRVLIKPFLLVSPALEKFSASLESLTSKLSGGVVPFPLHRHRELTDEEIETLVEMRREDGALAPTESEMIQEIIRLGNKTAKDCMTPRVDTKMISHASPNESVRAVVRGVAKPYWFLPVYKESPDTVIGLLDVKRWLYRPDSDFRDFINPPIFIPETMNALEVFRDYLSVPRSLGVVLDEYGGVEGVITHADIVEEILADAVPTSERNEEFEVIGRGHLRSDGDARLDEIGEALDMDLAHEGLDTIGGLVFNEIGHVPNPGTRVEIDGLAITVRRCQPQRILAVEIEKLEAGDTESGNAH